MFVVVVITQAKGHHSPPHPHPPEKKNCQNLPFCFIKNIHENSAKPIAL